MANNNDGKIVLSLDIPKTVSQINADIKKLEAQLIKVKTSASLDSKATVKQLNAQISALRSQLKTVNNVLSETSSLSKEARSELEGYIQEQNNGVSPDKWDEINAKLKETQSSMGLLGKLCRTFKNAMTQAAQSITQHFSVSSAVSLLISRTKESVTELKEVDTLLNKINKVSDGLSKSDLNRIADSSFDAAGKYGKKASDYLSAAEAAAHAGYKNAEEIAELSVAAQSAGGMTAQLANKMILAADSAYKMKGSAAELSKVLDGINYIANHNAVSMTELSEAMTDISSTASSLGVDANEAAAALGTMISVTRQSGSDAAGAFKAILLSTGQIADETEGIDGEALKRYEEACAALNVKLKETKNGVLSLRDPMEVLRELSIEYNKLGENDTRRSDLLNSLGDKSRSSQLDALLRQWETYETIKRQYSDGSGSMAADAEKTANSWEGSLNRLSNTWTDTVGNILNSDAVITAVNALNSLLSVINNITSKLGSLKSISLGAGLYAAFKNVGKDKRFSFTYLF